MFALLNLGVIVMRESHIASYDPGYRSPLYPWMQIFGILAPLVLIASMGPGPALFSTALIAVGVAWYFAYARDRVIRSGAIYHVFERLGRQRFPDLETELRSILKEKGLRDEDPFDEAVARASVLDLEWGVRASAARARPWCAASSRARASGPRPSSTASRSRTCASRESAPRSLSWRAPRRGSRSTSAASSAT
jgi:hypothetical protein